jgi:hypothetical protein
VQQERAWSMADWILEVLTAVLVKMAVFWDECLVLSRRNWQTLQRSLLSPSYHPDDGGQPRGYKSQYPTELSSLCSDGDSRNAKRMLWRKPLGKLSLGRPTKGCDIDMRWNLERMWRWEMNWLTDISSCGMGWVVLNLCFPPSGFAWLGISTAEVRISVVRNVTHEYKKATIRCKARCKKHVYIVFTDNVLGRRTFRKAQSRK